MLKNILSSLFAICLLVSCSNSSPYPQALDPLDGGRNFIESFMQGDVKKAHYYLKGDNENEHYFEQMKDQYLKLDKEGRQQLRQASIQINEVSAIDTTITIINYQNSFDKNAHKLKVIKTPDGWKVDLKYTYGPNL